MKILVLAGGLSPERDVSLSSGALIANALAEKGHRVLLVDAYLGREIPDGEDVDALFSCEKRYAYTVESTEPDLDRLMRESGRGRDLVGPNVIALAKAADVTFLALHGAAGENGQIQATLDSFGIRYTGSGYVGSLLAMDKELSKTLFRSVGIATPESICVRCGDADPEEILKAVGLPLVVKPCTCGSSVGISMVSTRDALREALLLAARYEDRVLIERRIIGREFTMAVLNGEALPPVEIIPKSGFYDYRNKYQAGFTEEICPAELPDGEIEGLKAITLRAFSALRLRDYARFDYIRDAEGVFWCLEANSLPGMTPTSLLPMEAAAVGIDYGAICERIAELGRAH